MSATVPPATLLPRNIFVPEQYPFANPVILSDFEKNYIKLILQISEQFIANNTMNLVIAGWYNVTFDNYPSLRELLPASYPDTIVALAGQITIAIQNLVAQTDQPLRDQFVPIGRRHYMHGAEAVTLLCASPCLVQSMYNLLTGTVERIVGLLEGLHDYPSFFTYPLKASGHLAATTRTESVGAPASLTPQETALIDSISRGSFGGANSLEGAFESAGAPGRAFGAFDPESGDRPKFYDPTVSILMMDPPAVTLGKAIPDYLVTRVLEGRAAGASHGGGLESTGQPDLLQRLTKALQGLPPDLRTLLRSSVDGKAAQLIGPLLEGKLDLGKLPELDLNGILQEIVAFVLRYVIPVLLIPFGRFVDVMVDIISAGLRTESAIRLVASWETQLQPRAEEFARRFWWTLLEISPNVRFSLGLQTGTQLELRLDELTALLVRGLSASFPRILDGGIDFKRELMDMGKRWQAAGWPIDGYDAARQAFLATVDAMLFASPIYARTLPAIRLKEAYAQLASVVITELVYGAGGNAFRPVGGILGMPMPFSGLVPA